MEWFRNKTKFFSNKRLNQDIESNVSSIPQINYNVYLVQRPCQKQPLYEEFKLFLIKVYDTYKAFIIASVNIVIILLLAFSLTEMFTSNCKVEDDLQISVKLKAYCNPYFPIDRVIVDIDLNSTSHCYSSKSCIILSKTLRKQQGYFRYNFIIGTYGFVYVEYGYNCQTDENEGALYIRLPVESIYNGQDFMAAHKAITKFNEILREGLECGKIFHNYTIVATGCRQFDKWCTHVLQELVTEALPEHGFKGVQRVYYDDTQGSTLFDPLSLKRVYNYQYKLVVCTQNNTSITKF